METQGQALFYAEQTVAWLASEVKLNAAVTFYFAVPWAACYLHHLFPSLLLSWFRAPSSWEHWSLQLGDCAAGSGTLIFEPVTAPPFLCKLNLFPCGLGSHTGETVIVFTKCLVIFLCDSAGACVPFCSTPICLVLPLRQDLKVNSQTWLVASVCLPASAFLSLTYCIL